MNIGTISVLSSTHLVNMLASYKNKDPINIGTQVICMQQPSQGKDRH